MSTTPKIQINRISRTRRLVAAAAVLASAFTAGTMVTVAGVDAAVNPGIDDTLTTPTTEPECWFHCPGDPGNDPGDGPDDKKTPPPVDEPDPEDPPVDVDEPVLATPTFTG